MIPSSSSAEPAPFAVVHRRLHEVAIRLGRAVTVRVDDPQLGSQVFSVADDGSPRIPPLGTPIPPGLSTQPGGPSPAEAAVVTELVAATIRATRYDDGARSDPEFALRRIPGVFAVVVDGNRALVRSTPDAPADVADRAAAALAAATGGPAPTTVDLVRDTAAPWETAIGPSRAPGTAELLVTRHVPGGPDSEWEVHLGDGPDRSVGRGSASLGPAGAVEATLRGLAALGHVPARLVWAHALETTRDHRFVVAVALERDGRVVHGIASGRDPVEAAALAALDAHGRP